jgi:hypothetical protein
LGGASTPGSHPHLSLFQTLTGFGQVAEFYFIAEKNEWIQPTVYQGVYNLLERQGETECV